MIRKIRMDEKLLNEGKDLTELLRQLEISEACGVPKFRFPSSSSTFVLVHQPAEDVATFQSNLARALGRVAT